MVHQNKKSMEIDKLNMRKVIIDSPKQLREGLILVPMNLSSRILGKVGTKDVKIVGDFKNIVVCGIGGSALPADVLNTVILLPVPIYIHRDYNLPPQANENSLIICISYSGNTEETVSALESAISKKLKIVCMATGGKVEELCQKNDIPLVKIPSGIQPRCATGYIFSVLVKILSNNGILTDMSQELSDVAESLEKINPTLENEGKKLAKKLVKKIPVVYASNTFKDIAMIWKIKFNENSKIPAFYNYFPELNHNEMVGFSQIKKNSNFHFIIIRDKNDHPRNLKRMNLFASLLKKKGAKTDFIEMKDGSLLFKVFSTLILGDWVSYYLALENKTDPTPVKMVEEFKELMSR